ncbi:MAG: hypothetical protein WD056_01500 [Gemmatimonadota bacterium]
MVAAPDARLRPLDSPFPIRVRVDPEGRPVELLRAPERRTPEEKRRRGSERVGRVMAIRETWRIDDEWWRRPISRLYHEIILESGRILVIYRDLVEGGWWE